MSTVVCKGISCGCTDGVNHSAECFAEHAAAVAGGLFISDPTSDLGRLAKELEVAYQAMADMGAGRLFGKQLTDAIEQLAAAQEEVNVKGKVILNAERIIRELGTQVDTLEEEVKRLTRQVDREASARSTMTDAWVEQKKENACLRGALQNLLTRFPDEETVEDLKADVGYGYRSYSITLKDGELVALRSALR